MKYNSNNKYNNNNDIKKFIKNVLDKRYKTKSRQFDINGIQKEYKLYLIPALKDDRASIYEGFLYIDTDNRDEVKYFREYERREVTGYMVRILFLFYRDSKGREKLLIKDYRDNRAITKNVDRITAVFNKKISKLLDQACIDNEKELEEAINKLFDRRDVIEEFYELYRKCKEFIMNKIKGVDESKKEEFVDNFIMQMMTLWYLQEKNFFNNDNRYFINKFKEVTSHEKLSYYTSEYRFKNYYEFLLYLFEKLQDSADKQYYEDNIVGKVVIIGPAVFLNGSYSSKNIYIPDECFYKDGFTEELIKKEAKKINDNIPLLNLFESRDWIEGDINEYVIGSLYEKLITGIEKKHRGAYYTPEIITQYICKNTIEPYLLDKVNSKFNCDYKDIHTAIEQANRDILKYLFEELKNIKILDPAVGSAHFLESAMDVLVTLYRKIIEKAKNLGLIEGFNILYVDENGKIAEIDLLNISNDERFTLYVKFFIILARNLYGVDIMHTAINIAKARLFLTLAKHFDANKGDLFIRLPNIHFNLMVGNSLIGYIDISTNPKAELTDFFSVELRSHNILSSIISNDFKDWLLQTATLLNKHSIITIRSNIINEIQILNEKLNKPTLYHDDLLEILRIKSNLVNILIVAVNSKYAKDLNELLKHIDDEFNKKLDEMFIRKYNINRSELERCKRFQWILHFPEVRLRGGFDIIIGNPPYVRHEDIDDIEPGVKYKAILEKLYNPYDSTFDYSMYFILRSIQLLNDGGYHSFIITNKWLRAAYGRKIRKYLREFTIKRVIDFTRIKVFVGATVDTMIYVIQKQKPNDDNLILYNSPSDLKDIEQGIINFKQKYLSDDGWILEDRVLALREKIEKIGKPLKDWDANIYFGIKTGFNDAFIIDTDTKEKILSNCKSNEERERTEKVIKPVLRGRDIERYHYKWAGLWLVKIEAGWTNNNRGKERAEEFFKKSFPSLYDHFMSFANKTTEGKKGKGLFDRDDKGDYWWELRPCNYYDEFEKEKIIWQEMSNNPSFAYDMKRFFINQTAYMITGNNLKYIIAILNSRVSEWYMQNTAYSLSEGAKRWIRQYVERIHIPPITSQNEQIVNQIVNLVDQILAITQSEDYEQDKNKQEEVRKYEKQIDELVYKLYNLTEEEIELLKRITS
jgi:hypothetical protein